VEYPGAEQVSPKLKHLLPDIILRINGDGIYHLEAQIQDDPEISRRMFEYGFQEGLRGKSSDTGFITIRFPQALVIYLGNVKTAGEKQTFKLIFPDGTSHDFAVETFTLLSYTPGELEKRNLHLLLPFYILKLRKPAALLRTSAERRKLAVEMRKLLDTLVAIVQRGVKSGILTSEDEFMVMELMERLYKELYQGYTEFMEADMRLRDHILTYSEEAALKAERRTEKRVREELLTYSEQAARAAEKRTEKQIRQETALKMKRANFPMDQIVLFSGLSVEEIKQL
jgi:PHD/YefM family antitoxin component YafN of YafNO toxin-antitoxin module